MNKKIFKSNGNYLGFISNDYIFSRDGVYLGWLEGNLFWHSNGNFGGSLTEINGSLYLIINRLQIPPIPRIPKLPPLPPLPPVPPINIMPIQLPIGYVDAFR